MNTTSASMSTPSEATEAASLRQNGGAVSILGVRVDALTWEAFEARVRDFVRSGQPHHVVTVNPEFVMAAQRDPAFGRVLAAADLALADGWGLLWAARRLGQPLPARITGSDGAPRLAALAAQEGWRLFLLGAGPGIAQRAADVLRTRHPALQIVGVFAGSPRADEEEAIVARIAAARPHVLFVAYGAPAQDLWIARTQPRLQIPLAMGVGGSLDFIAGVRQRAPASVQRLHLEWLFRLLQEPWRWRRQLALPRFVWAVLRAAGRDAA